MTPLLLDRLIVHNVRAGRYPTAVVQAVRTLITATDVDAVALLEARAYVRALRRAFPGWQVRHHRTDIVLMVRRGHVPIRRTLPLRIHRRWWGPHQGRPHQGRTHLLVDIGRTDDPGRLRLILIHRVPGGPSGGILTRGANRPAWDAEHSMLTRVADRPGSHRRPLLIAGDQNATTSLSLIHI